MRVLKITASLAALCTATALHAEPVVRLFELQTVPEKRQLFVDTGRDNMGTSLATEDGTLAMHALRRRDDADFNYVFEVYRDKAAYEAHAASAHFGRFVAAAREMLRGRKVLETTPRFLFERQPLKVLSSADEPVVQLDEVLVKPGRGRAFSRIVMNGMRESMRRDPGILALYAVTLKDQSDSWRFITIHATSAVRQAHRQVPHRQKLAQLTAPLIASQQLYELDGLALTSKGTLRPDEFTQPQRR